MKMTMRQKAEKFILRRFSEKNCYLVEEDGKYLWGDDVEDAVEFTRGDAEREQSELAFETKLEGVVDRELQSMYFMIEKICR